MKRFINWGLKLSITFYALLHFFTYFYEVEFLLYLLSASGLLTILFTGMMLTVKQFKLPLFLFLVGVTVLIFSEGSFIDGLYNGFLQMRGIIGLLIIVPMIGWVLREEPYIEEVLAFAHKGIDSSRKFYFGIVSFTQVISYFLLFGSIPMMYQFITTILKNQRGEAWENFKGTALLRAFALSTMWVISIPSFIFAVETMQASLWISVLQGLGIAILGSIVAVIFSYFQEKRYGINLTAALKTEIDTVLRSYSNKEEIKKKVIEFVLLFVTLFGTIFLLHATFSVNLMLTIPIVVVIWTCVYYFVKKRMKNLVRETRRYYESGMVRQSYQLCILLSAGVLIYGLNQTGFGVAVIAGIQYIQEILPFLNFLYLLPFIVIFLGFIGLGPLTVMVLVAGLLESISLPYPPELIVLTITSGSVISILLSPLIMPVIVLSASNGLSLFKNGIQFNLKYAVVFYIIVQVYVQIMIRVW
ncbi:hypothetical protein [Virgibacillus necropolis]|uniref:Permease n=1 Tax=Virgibacillus necropolis TaxID=163877 RepID=A0A221MA29_9BACI|nr:hypothetical protein [Virgibacillus necropolis]ASN04518.1 hypothetical protein CFK40_05585 [Virgibacillus necropolis]